MKEIATTSKISNLRIWQQAFFDEDNVVLVVTDEALDMIASKSSDLNIGARGLKSVMSSVLRKIRSDVLDGNLNDNEITITKDTIENPSKYLVKKIKKDMVIMNYQNVLEKIISNELNNKTKSKLLLQACCAPCSSYVLEYLSEIFEITIYFIIPIYIQKANL